MPAARTITRADLLPVDAYAKVRKERRQALLEKKKHRRLEVGPVASFLFESYDSMWLQVQEMLYIPRGDELVATVLFEIDEPQRRKSFLGRLGGVEETAFLSFAGETVDGKPEADMDRTTAEGKASAVQFLHFRFTPEQIAKFRTPGTQIVLGFRHAAYAHMAVMPEAVRAALAEDFA